MFFKENAISLDYSDCKQSALYFDKLIPLNNDIFFDLALELKTDLPNLLPNELANWNLDPFLQGIYLSDPYYMEDHYKKFKSPASAIVLLHHYLSSRKDWFTNMKASGGIDGMMGISPSEIELRGWYMSDILNIIHCIPSTVSLLPDEATDKIQEDGEDVRLTLQNLELIDTSKASWKQILELRKDLDSIKKIRSLKLFFYSNYKDKSIGFIKEDVQKRMEEYKETAKSWGFKLKHKTIDCVLSSKSLRCLEGSSVVAAAFGEKSLATIAAACGSTIEFAKVAITIAKAKRTQIKNLRPHPFEFIFRTNNKLITS